MPLNIIQIVANIFAFSEAFILIGIIFTVLTIISTYFKKIKIDYQYFIFGVFLYFTHRLMIFINAYKQINIASEQGLIVIIFSYIPLMLSGMFLYYGADMLLKELRSSK